jgi:hypothetical protein
MTRTQTMVSSATALMLASVIALLAVPGRTGGLYAEIQRLANRVAPAMDAISGSIAEHPAEMIPP